MFILRFIWSVLTSRWLWTLIGLVLVSLIIWVFGPVVRVGTMQPFASETVRIAVIAVLVILWLIRLIVLQRRAIMANRMFVSELAAPVEKPEPTPGELGVAAVGEKFQETMAELKRRKLGGRKFLRDIPWYVIVGPPATGKTTALHQSGLHFPVNLTDDLQGIGGTRNCDWFFTEQAVLIDTAGRYTQQESQPDVDAAEWLGFLNLLKKHRGRRALNGVIVALSVDMLSEDDKAIRAHGRTIRKRLAELNGQLEIRLPVYLMLTKADLIRGFEPFFGNLSTSAREQVWGTTFPPDTRLEEGAVAREILALSAELEKRLVPRLENEERLPVRAEIFRFPGQLESLARPIQLLADVIFGESAYEENTWLRGVYLTSATQEGAPIDRLTASLASSFGLPAQTTPVVQRVEKRSFFLKNLLTEVIFKEAGLGIFDPNAEWRRMWIWRGAAAAAVLAVVIGASFTTLAYLDQREAVAAQAAELERLRAELTPVATTKATIEPLDLYVALQAADEVAAIATEPRGGLRDVIGPSASAELERSQRDAYHRTLRNILEPRMAALLEATMWRQIRDPDYMLGALKTYRMMTGLSQMDPEFAQYWWLNMLPEHAPLQPFPSQEAAEHQVAALARMAIDDRYVAPDEALVRQALNSVCSVPLPVRAYRSLLAHPEVAALPEWIPANFAGPNGSKVFTRRSGRTLRVGLPGAFTYSGFHDVILELIEEVTAEAALDRTVFAGGCDESAETSIPALTADVLKLYYDDFVAQWDSFLRDIRLAQLTDLNVASDNLKDLSSADSALKRLVTAVVRETELTRVEDETDESASSGRPPRAASRVLGRLGKVGRLARQGMRLLPSTTGAAAETDISGAPVADHFKPIKGAVAEIDGLPPQLDATVVALTALSNMIQTVSASPDPQEAIKRQGGLAELTGAVAAQARSLPGPLDDWLAGIAGDTTGLTERAVTGQLNAIWRAEVLPFCQAALANRYPFDPSSAIDVNIRDFARLFGPGGMIDAFINDHLIGYVDTTSKPWRWRADFGLNPSVLAAFQQARQIRDELFASGSGPVMNFTLEPKDLSAGAARVTLNLDGQTLTFFHNATRPQPLSWPGSDGTGVVTLAFQPVDGSPEVLVTETGSWAWLRMLRSGQFTSTNLPEVYRLRLAGRGHYADFELRASSVENPYSLEMFARFTCPENI